jgi:hypothetical protein
MTTSRKLEDIASNLDDMSTTLEEIKDRVGEEPAVRDRLDSLRTDMLRTAELIEESLETAAPSPAETVTPPAPGRDD